MSQKAHETDRQPTGKSPFCCNRDQKVPPRGISKQAKIWANWCVRVSPPPSWAPFSTPELLDAPVWGLTERMRNCLPRSELPSPASARLRVGALDAARPGRRAVAVSVGRKTGCGEETTISPGSLAHEQTEAHITSANINPSARTGNIRAKSRRDPWCPAASSNSPLTISFTAQPACRHLPLLPMKGVQPASLLRLLYLLYNMNCRGLNPATRRHLSQ